jgi:hypothetical protein
MKKTKIFILIIFISNSSVAVAKSNEFFKTNLSGNTFSAVNLVTNVVVEDPLIRQLEDWIESKKIELMRTDSNHFSYGSIQRQLKVYQGDLERVKIERQLWDNYKNARTIRNPTEIAKADRALALFIATQQQINTGKPIPKDPKLKEVIQGASKMEVTSDPVIWKRRITLVVSSLMLLCPLLFLWRRQVQRGR